jgi:nitroimidazol reductase NimA-like FMN-containing flavoprotein (pyridoxamine 5'-phosphate oxidase superfamily)
MVQSTPAKMGRPALAMTRGERDAFLRPQPICRVATVGRAGRPRLSALWFVWDGTAMWFNSLVRSRRWAELERDPRLTAIVDDGGADFQKLRGVTLTGTARIIGEVPRRGEDVAALVEPERMFAEKYMGGGSFRYDGRHGWLKLIPDRIVSWDFSKMPRRG